MKHMAYGVLCGVLLTLFVWTVMLADRRAGLIQRGLAEYCATDGRFAFKGECQ